jgi:hypothetical protein
MAVSTVYNLNEQLEAFFSATSVSRSVCDSLARDIAGEDTAPIPVEIQGNCSYSVYAGRNLELVIQFRLKSLSVDVLKAQLAKTVHGGLAPDCSFQGQVGDYEEHKEPLSVYEMTRVRGISHLDFVLANGYPENTQINFTRRKTLITDVAR